MLAGMKHDRQRSNGRSGGQDPLQPPRAERVAPELTFTPRGEPDPRLIQLARLLGRQLARETFEAETLAARPHRSR